MIIVFPLLHRLFNPSLTDFFIDHGKRRLQEEKKGNTMGIATAIDQRKIVLKRTATVMGNHVLSVSRLEISLLWRERLVSFGALIPAVIVLKKESLK